MTLACSASCAIYRGVPVELGLGAFAGGDVTVVLELLLAPRFGCGPDTPNQRP